MLGGLARSRRKEKIMQNNDSFFDCVERLAEIGAADGAGGEGAREAGPAASPYLEQDGKIVTVPLRE